uniref:hypothetical protein n=1 Tax=Helicobacter bizzozeronii TaxID=56877 RepID=UPI0013156714
MEFEKRLLNQQKQNHTQPRQQEQITPKPPSSQLQEPTQVEQRSSNQQIQKTTTQKKVSPKDQTACQKYRA